MTTTRRPTQLCPLSMRGPITIAALLVSLALTTPAAAQDSSSPQSAPPAPAAVTTESRHWLPEPRILAQAVEMFGTRFHERTTGSSEGFYPELGGMITGSGWVSAGPGYRQHYFNDRAVLDASAAVSWRAYKFARARFEVSDLVHGRVSIGAMARWQDATQVNYFGLGGDSRQDDRSEYRLRSLDATGYTRLQVSRAFAMDANVGLLRRPTLSAPVGPFDAGLPDTRQVFSEQDAPGISAPSAMLHAGISMTVDTRDRPGYARDGGLVSANVTHYSDRDAHNASFTRYEAEAVRYVPLLDGRWDLAVHGWLAASATAAGQTVPFYLLPSLGGSNTLRSYMSYRFHDRDLLVVNAESRWAFFRHVDAAVFVDAGNVAPRLRDLDLAKTSVGFGLRAHTRTATVARVDVAHGREGWRVLLRLDDLLALTRLARRAPSMPFVS